MPRRGSGALGTPRIASAAAAAAAITTYSTSPPPGMLRLLAAHRRRLRPIAAGVGLAVGAAVTMGVGSNESEGRRRRGSGMDTAACAGAAASTLKRPLIVGLAGCTASGKSTLCDAIVARQGGTAAVAVVTLDDFWWKDESRLPRLSDEWLAANPNMARLKQHDTNVPAAVDWAAAEAHVRAAIAEATAAGVEVLIVEGFLLFSQPQLVALLDRGVYLTVDDSEKPTLMMRKFQRNGKPSYEARGISIEEYTRYWDECVIDRFVKFGTERPADTIDLPCMMPTAEQVERLAAELPLPLP